MVLLVDALHRWLGQTTRCGFLGVKTPNAILSCPVSRARDSYPYQSPHCRRGLFVLSNEPVVTGGLVASVVEAPPHIDRTTPRLCLTCLCSRPVNAPRRSGFRAAARASSLPRPRGKDSRACCIRRCCALSRRACRLLHRAPTAIWRGHGRYQGTCPSLSATLMAIKVSPSLSLHRAYSVVPSTAPWSPIQSRASHLRICCTWCSMRQSLTRQLMA